MTVHILYENADWLPPLVRALEARGLPYRPWFVDGGEIDLTSPPPEGIFVNRMSPSAHTRGHQGGVIFLREYLAVLEQHGRRVINGSSAFALEVSKIRQDLTLRAAGIDTPRTVAVVGAGKLKEAARTLGTPFLTKHNQGGKGLGVQLFRTLEAFDDYVDSGALADVPDGVTILQQYIAPPEPFVTRVEIVDGRFLYAIRSSTAQGFELCPADACAVGEGAFCPVGPELSTEVVSTGSLWAPPPPELPRFSLRPEIGPEDPLVKKYIAYCAEHGLDVAGIEFVEDAEGRRYTYDVNANSNYNAAVEAEHGLDGMGAIAELCARALEALHGSQRVRVLQAG